MNAAFACQQCAGNAGAPCPPIGVRADSFSKGRQQDTSTHHRCPSPASVMSTRTAHPRPPAERLPCAGPGDYLLSPQPSYQHSQHHSTSNNEAQHQPGMATLARLAASPRQAQQPMAEMGIAAKAAAIKGAGAVHEFALTNHSNQMCVRLAHCGEVERQLVCP